MNNLKKKSVRNVVGRIADRAFTLLALVIFCSTIGEQKVALAQTNAATSPSAKLESNLVFASLGGGVQDALQKCAIDPFQKSTGVRVDYVAAQPAETLARIIAQRSSPTIDVMWGTLAEQYRGFKQGVFVPLTSAMIPNLRNIDPKFSPKQNAGAEIATSIFGLGYNQKVFQEHGFAAPTSWNDLWDPKFKGHVGIYNVAIPVGQGTLAAVALLNGGSVSNIDPGFAALSKLKPNLYTIFSQAPQFDQAFLDQRVWIGLVNSSRMETLNQQGNPMGFVQPKEGIVLSVISLQIVKGAPHPAAAAAFVNWMLGKEAQQCLASAVGYTPVIDGVSVPDNVKVYLLPEVKVLPVDWEGMQDHLVDWLKRWNEQMQD